MHNGKIIIHNFSIKSIAILLLALYFFLAPLEDILTSGIGTLGKYIIVIIMGILLIPTLQSRKAFFSAEIWGISCLALYLILLAWVSLAWASSLTTALSRNSAYTTLPLVLVVLSMHSYSYEEYIIIKKSAIAGGLFAVVFILYTQGISHVLTGRMTLTDIGNDPNNLAALFLLPVGLSFEYMMQAKGHKKILFILLFGILSSFMLFTGSRGGLLALALLVISYLIIGEYIKKPIRLILLLFLIISLLLIIVNLLPESTFLRLFTLESYRNTNDAVGNRGDIWRHIIFDIIPKMKPWGYGSGCAFAQLRQFYGYDKGVHNTYLCMIVEYGILGIPVFVLLLGRMLKRLHLTQHTIEFSLMVGIMCIIFFLDAYAKKFFWNILYIAVIGLRTMRNEQ